MTLDERLLILLVKNLMKMMQGSRNLGFPILYGDGSRPSVLQFAGISSPKAVISSPKAVMVMYTGRKRTIEAVQSIRLAFPATPIYAQALDFKHLLELKEAGATDAILENAEPSPQLGSKLLKGLGVMSNDVSFLSQIVRDSMELQAQAVNKTAAQESNVMKSLQVRVADLVSTQTLVPSPSTKDESQRMSQRAGNHIQTLPEEGDRIEYSDKLDESEDGRGVLYCELEPDNNSPIKKMLIWRNYTRSIKILPNNPL